jgi:ribosomal protein S18 acetylase RimI-like enzyme
MICRPARIDDLFGMVTCETEFPEEMQTPIEMYAAWGCDAFVVRPEKEVRGCLWWRIHKGRLEIVSLAVRTVFRGQGHAHDLLDTAHDNARRLGIKKAFLDVVPENHRARAIYESFGYRVVGRTKHGALRMQVEL